MAAEQADIQTGDVVAIWGAGPVGQFALRAAQLLGASTVIAIDRVASRLRMAQRHGAEVLNYQEVKLQTALRDLTGGRGPDVCIDAVGLEAHGTGPLALYDRVATSVRFETDRSTALREALLACRKGGTVSLAGVYGGLIDKVPMGAAFNKGLTFKMGQPHVHKYLRPLLQRIEEDQVDPSFIVTHRMSLEDGPLAYELFKHKKDGCIKVVLKPGD